MPDPQERSWSGNANAPKIPHELYFHEKAYFAGVLIASILYGIILVLFFKCIAALFNPVYRKGEGIKWGLVSYTVAMFSVVTIGTAMGLDIQSISYIDNREFSGAKSVSDPGPYGYQLLIETEAVYIVPNLMFLLNNWLADGLLLYRCYVIYSANLWAIVFPCLIYLGSLTMGILTLYQASIPVVISDVWFGYPYFSISIFLNVLLTLMIIIRLIVYTRNARTALGITGIGGLSKIIVIMLIESCALYTMSSSLVVGVIDIFLPILAENQVIAALLIIQRVANKSALTSETVASGRISSFKARSQGELTGLAGGSGALPGGDLMSFADEHRINSGELGVGIEDIDSHQE